MGYNNYYYYHSSIPYWPFRAWDSRIPVRGGWVRGLREGKAG